MTKFIKKKVNANIVVDGKTFKGLSLNKEYNMGAL